MRCTRTILFFVTIIASISAAQTNPNGGILPFSTQEHGVDLATGAVSFSVPIRAKVGKIPFTFSLFDNTGIWKLQFVEGTPQWWTSDYSYEITALPQQYVSLGANSSTCDQEGGTYHGLYLADITGAQHPLSGSISCNQAVQDLTGTLGDGSGYSIVMTDGAGTVYDRSGNAFTLYPRLNGDRQPSTWTFTDPDGATIIASTVNGVWPGEFLDSLSQNALSFTYTGPPNEIYTYTYTDETNNDRSYTYSPSSVYNWVTAFGCAGINDSNYSSYFGLPTGISTPTGENYTMSYEQTPGLGSGNTTGRLSQVTFPTGGSISYAYGGGNNGINCNSGVVPSLTVKITDNNGHTDKWIYTNSNNSSTAGPYTVTVQDPASNYTLYSFAGEYQTRKEVYEGSIAASHLLSKTVICYNAVFTTCATPSKVPALPFTQIDTYSYPGTSTSPSLQEIKYDIYGNVTEVKQYGFGAPVPPSGNPVLDTTITYNGENGVTCGTLSNAYMFDRPCSITTVTNVSNSNVTVNQTIFTYNATGHVLETQRFVSGSAQLTSYAAYNPNNGTITSSTDVNNAVTNYYYNGTGGCSGLLPTSTTFPVDGLSTSQQWNCNGGVLTQTTDANGQPTNYGYKNMGGTAADPLWRPLSVEDPLLNFTWNTYTPASTTSFETTESALNFNGAMSTSEQLATIDGLSRPIYSQRSQGQGSSTFDSTQTAYGWTVTTSTVPGGAFTTNSVPYSGTAGQQAPTGTAVTTTQYDALGRPLTVTDGGGGTRSYSYSLNDVMVTIGPQVTQPATENLKQRQLEYDGLGRLTSVCEITSILGSGSCGQSNSATGFLTKYSYTYNSSGNLIVSVTQNAQPNAIGGTQTRTYTYDGLNRLTSETNPEWSQGTVTYTYDSDPTGKCPGPYKGDLVNRTDNAGNVTCYSYDGLHRVLSTTYAGPNATTNRYFVYDSANVNGQAMAYAQGRVAEAYTATCPTCSKVTDEGFGYTKRGELANFYEATPNSAEYYSVPITYWANGLVETFGPFLTENQVSIAPDGEGRPYAISGASSNVPSITYNYASQPTTLMTGCAGGATCYPINYSYDQNTLRMTQYSAALNTGTPSGSLTWNRMEACNSWLSSIPRLPPITRRVLIAPTI